MAFSTPPANLGGSLVIDGNYSTGGNDATMGIRTLVATNVVTGATLTLKIDDVLAYVRTAYAAPVAQVNTLNFSASTFVAGNLYKVTVRRFDTDQAVTYNVVAQSTSTATFATDFIAAVTTSYNNGGILSASSPGASQATLTQAVDTGGFAITAKPVGTTDTASTAYVSGSGSLSEVQQYDPTATAAAFTKYTFVVKTRTVGGESFNTSNLVYILWANTAGTNYAAFNTAYVAFVTASGLSDSVAKPYVKIG